MVIAEIARPTHKGGTQPLSVRLLVQSKLYWGLAALYLVGILSSPRTSKGDNIFLSLGNQTDVLRQVSVSGIVAVGMTMVIFLGGIDLSVGSLMAFSTVICAMLLTIKGWTAATTLGVGAAAVVSFVSVLSVLSFLAANLRSTLDQRNLRLPRAVRLSLAAVAVLAAIGLAIWLSSYAPGRFGVLAVLVAVPCVGALVGALSGATIVYGRLQPFIVTLAMMVSALGLARVIAGQDQAVYPVYTGTNATENFEILRNLLWGVLPVPGIFFLAILVIFWLITRFTIYGAYLLAIGGNEEAARLAGINVKSTKIVAYAVSGLLAALAGILYVAQFRQGKPDAGVGLELDAIAAVVIGGTRLMGGKGSVAGTMVGVLIFGFLGNILQLNNIDSNTQLILKGLIIVAAVLMQEGQFGGIFTRRRER
jgi:simple sugar transport system permease protein